jgi:hypothetical protein
MASITLKSGFFTKNQVDVYSETKEKRQLYLKEPFSGKWAIVT